MNAEICRDAETTFTDNHCRPNFFIVGAPKCGTTAWADYLGEHKDVFLCKPKEPHFFNTDIPGFRWFRSEDEYLSLFETAGSAKVIGEASVMYLYSHAAAANIAQFAPDAKILIFVRRHGPFIASYHQQLVYTLDEDETDLAKAWAGPRSSAPPDCRDPKLLDYKSVGKFAEQIGRYRERFPSEQIKVVRFEDWTSDTRQAYVDILDFLGVEDDGRTEFAKVNAARRHRWAALANLTQRPPDVVKTAMKVLRKLPGLGGLRLAHAVRKVNRVEGYAAKPSAELLAEIDRHYANDAKQLRQLLEPSEAGAATVAERP